MFSSLNRQFSTDAEEKRELLFQVFGFLNFYLPYSMRNFNSEHRIGRVHWKNVVLVNNNYEIVA